MARTRHFGIPLRPAWRRLSIAVVAVAAAASLPLIQQQAAQALADPAEPVTGNATHFFGLGGPYGGCGMPESALETLNYIALNVYNTPKDYVYYSRPMPDGDAKIGMYNNGHNCGRWVQVSVGDFCTGFNDGNKNEPFCKKGEWIKDDFNGATLNMLVADSCGDDNAWCRDDPYHIDLHEDSLDKFVKDGKPVGNMRPDHWNNRHMSWKFIPAPNYSGDIQIGFVQGAETWWAAASISHLANGIHGVQYYSGGKWTDAVMNGDMGQTWVLRPYEPGGTTFSIRVRDVDEKYINDGRVYTFDLPTACDPKCTGDYHKVSYTTSAEVPTGPTPGTSGSATPTGTCSATVKAADSWPDGYRAEATVTAETKIKGWKVSWTPAPGQTIGDVWNGIRADEGSTVTVKNQSWNGALAAKSSTSFGFNVKGGSEVPKLTCSPA